MRFGSVCSGIEAASVAWHPLGFRAQWLAELADFPSRVLAHHYPAVTNYGDFTGIPSSAVAIDLLAGGTPCQSFSIAGLRGGLADDRGNLALEFLRLADRFRPRWILWENVPGVLSSNGGRDFGSILGALAELGYGFAYRVLDAQFFGVPQRRRRVFLVGYLGDWRRAAAVLFERESLQRDPKQSRKARAQIARGAASGTGDGGPVAFDTTQITSKTNRSRPEPGDPCPTLAAQAHPLAAQAHPPAIAFHPTQDPISGTVKPCLSRTVDGMGIAVPERVVAHALTCHAAKGGDPTTDNYTVQDYRVRRLTPRECERLQGFPDDYTAIPGAKDGPRYRALGNSMAVPCMAWIGRRILAVDSLR